MSKYANVFINPKGLLRIKHILELREEIEY